MGRIIHSIQIFYLQIHLVSWGGTQMCHFMTACHTFTELLPAVHDAMYTTDIKKEERDALFTVTNIFVVVLLADLKPFFKDGLLRAMDKSVLLCSTVYRKSVDTADKFKDVSTVKADKYIEDVSLDGNGNLNGKMMINAATHTFRFNRHSKGTRRKSPEEELRDVKDKLTKVKVCCFFKC